MKKPLGGQPMGFSQIISNFDFLPRYVTNMLPGENRLDVSVVLGCGGYSRGSGTLLGGRLATTDHEHGAADEQ
jgi:hypothetical protein